MKNKRAFVVTPYRIDNWDGHVPFEIVFARSREQAAAAYAIHLCQHADLCDPDQLGLDESNPEEPYVYRIRIRASGLRHILGPLYDELVEDWGPVVLDRKEHEYEADLLARVFMGDLEPTGRGHADRRR